MIGNKHSKNQEKIRRRLYRKVSHQHRGEYRSARLRREDAGARDFTKIAL